jgi:hypothetical protein
MGLSSHYSSLLCWPLPDTHVCPQQNGSIPPTQTVFLQGLLKLNSVPLVSERTTPTERSPLVGKVSANFCE